MTTNVPTVDIFDARSRSWCPTHEYNRTFLRAQESYVNDVLRMRGHVFLNDVYDLLGLDRTPAGAITGWLYTKDAPTHIELKIVKVTPENAITLDLDVDGIIYDKI